MIFNISGRRSGKTTEAVKWLNNSETRRLVVFNNSERDRIVNEFNVPVHKIVSWQSSRDKFLGTTLEYAIDNVEMFIEDSLGRSVEVVWGSQYEK